MQDTLAGCGHDVHVLNYLPFAGRRDSLVKGWRYKGSLLKGVPRKVLRTAAMGGIVRSFNNFRNKALNLTTECRSLEDLAQASAVLDGVITGSDQVWHFNREPAYFLAWGKPDQFKRISYAPSCATDVQNYSRSSEIKKFLEQFCAVSVRDEASRRAIHRATGIEAQVVADPTLLWDPASREVEVSVDKPYVLTYILGEADPSKIKAAAQAAKRTVDAYEVRAVVAASHNLRWPREADHTHWSASPGEWLSLIKGSSFLLTDSFHACLFALKYGIPFVGFYSEPVRAPRLMDLAERYHLHDNICSLDDLAARCAKAVSCGSPDTPGALQTHVRLSRRFLEEALS